MLPEQSVTSDVPCGAAGRHNRQLDSCTHAASRPDVRSSITAVGVPQWSFEIVSVGYGGRSIDEFVELLSLNGVDLVVDVRLNPVSRKRGFSRSALAHALAGVGIGYRHERQLGNPKPNRDPFREGLQSARDLYVRHLRNGALRVYRDVIDLAQGARIALLCYEREHHECHRSCILEMAQREHPALRVLTL